MNIPVRPDVLPEDPYSIALYRQHWQPIWTKEATDNRIQDRYNFTLHEMTVESCLSYLTEVSEEAYRALIAKYGDVFQQIQERLDSDLNDVVDDEERDRQEKKHYLFKIYQQFERHLKELPVVGFNSGKYDVNAMKVDFFLQNW